MKDTKETAREGLRCWLDVPASRLRIVFVSCWTSEESFDFFVYLKDAPPGFARRTYQTVLQDDGTRTYHDITYPTDADMSARRKADPEWDR